MFFPAEQLNLIDENHQITDFLDMNEKSNLFFTCKLSPAYVPNFFPQLKWIQCFIIAYLLIELIDLFSLFYLILILPFSFVPSWVFLLEVSAVSFSNFKAPFVINFYS